MSQSTITLIIIGCTCALYLTEKFSVALTTALGMLALIFAGVLSFDDAFNCFANDTVMLIIGMITIVDALTESGVTPKLGRLLTRMTNIQEKNFLIIVMLAAGALSMFSSNSAVVSMFMPIITSVVLATNDRITRKNTFFPLAIGSLVGGTGSLAGSTAPLLANNVLRELGQETMGFFTTAPVAWSALLTIAACYWLFLYKIQKKWFDFPDTADERDAHPEDIPVDKRKAVITIMVFVSCVTLFIIQPFGWGLGFIAIVGAVVLMVTGCVDGAKALRNMRWSTVVTIGAALAIAKGFVSSGAGNMIMGWLVKALGDWILNPLVLVTLFLVSGFLLSQFMANGSLVSILTGMAVPMAVEIGMNPIPVALACVMGSSLALATPVATMTITLVQVAGYRFKDYLRMGGLVGLIGLAASWLAIVLIYGLI